MSAIPDHTGDPAGLDRLDDLRDSSAGCTRCDLYRHARGTVFGAGRESAWLMLVGEQPGDQEDLAGEPFVGPAGRVLDRALTDAGIRRDETYVTNAVKHFKFEQRGKRRIHQKPNAAEIRACRPWLDAELRVVRPTMLVALGATAAQALLGPSFRVTAHRGEVIDWEGGPRIVPTVHPSSILRAPDDKRAAAYDWLVADLRVVAREGGG
jgi:DNA polymerase